MDHPKVLPGVTLRFNGAAIWRSRKWRGHADAGAGRVASMEPRSGDRGNEGITNTGLTSGLLQWSRDLEIAEIARARGRHRSGRRASMEPRSGDRGNPLFLNQGP